MNNKSGIYKITNTTNNKIYIGSTVNFNRRWWSHRAKNNSGCPKLYNAIKKYGKDNFLFEPIEIIDLSQMTKEEGQAVLWEREQYYLDTMNPFDNNGYNTSPTAKNDHIQVGSHTFDHNKPVSQFNLSGEWISDFPSMKDAANKCGIHDTSITDCCRGVKKSAGNYMWRLKTSKRKISPYISKVKKLVCQSTIDNKVIKIWESGTLAAKTLNIHKSGISDCCSGNIQTSGGFRWSYVK